MDRAAFDLYLSAVRDFEADIFVRQLADELSKLPRRNRENAGFLDGSRRMDRMIREMLAYARVTQDVATDETVDLDRVFGHVVTDLGSEVKHTGARITHDPLPPVRGSEVLLTQLLQNLVGNAVKFRGDRPPRIHVAVTKRETVWQFGVQDSGIGIGPEQQDRVFGLFHRGGAPSDVPGTGVGLAICRKIVERLGGRIWVESELGRGATFLFTLPR